MIKAEKRSNEVLHKFNFSRNGDKKMKLTQIAMSGICLCSLLSFATISANASVKNGTSWQTAEYSNIPPKGGTKFNMSQGSKKTTSSNTCSIRGSYGALLAPYARLVSSGKQDRSKACKVTQSVSHPALFSTASKGSTFYTKVSTSNIDPGYIEVTLQFSADHID